VVPEVERVHVAEIRVVQEVMVAQVVSVVLGVVELQAQA